jgi:NAD-dependent dihydropyrimidine dehydrogenase PreA subunit
VLLTSRSTSTSAPYAAGVDSSEDCIRIVPIEDIAGTQGEGPASALILQEDYCIRCALCIERCPTDALSMVGWNESSTGMRDLEPVSA